MPNAENLINGKRTQFRAGEEQVEIARRGGIASGEARRKKKQTAELMKNILNSSLEGKNKQTVKAFASELEDEDLTVNALMAAGLVKAAATGNVKAFEAVQRYIGTDEQETKDEYHLPITDITTDFVNVYRLIHEVWNGESDVHEIISKGGRGSIKSNFWAAIVEETIYNDEQAHCVFTRRYKTDLRGSVYNQFMKTVIRHGRIDDWEFTTSPMRAVYKKTGQQVLFVGADKPISLKSYNVTFGYVKMLLHEEADEMAGVAPPQIANNFMNAYVEEKRNDPSTFIAHSYYYNVPQKWLGKRFFERAEWFKQHKPRYYQNNYLGEVTGTGGAIFDNVETRKLTDEFIQELPYFYYGLDFGYEHPQVFIKAYYDSDTDILYPVEEVYSRRCKNSTFARKISKYKNVEILADSARPDNIKEMQDWGFDIIGAKKRWGANNGRDYCWEWLRQCNKIVVDPERTPRLYKELTTLEFELLKDGSFSSEYPRLNEDCIMALIYGLNRVIMETRREDLYIDEMDEDVENEFDD